MISSSTRIATIADLGRIVEIYNWAILNTTATFDTETKTISQRESWFNEHDDQFPIIVIEEEDKVLAWGSLSRWSDRLAYDVTAEVSFYVEPKAHGRGLGNLILKELIDLGKQTNKLSVLSRVTSESEVSLHLHKKLGFSSMGVMRQCGVKFNKVLDVHFLQYLY